MPFYLQVVAPKKLKLAEAEAEMAVQMEKLNLKRAQLKEVNKQGGEIMRMLELKGLSQPLPCFCLHPGTRLTKLLEISTRKYLTIKRNS